MQITVLLIDKLRELVHEILCNLFSCDLNHFRNILRQWWVPRTEANYLNLKVFVPGTWDVA